MNKIIKNSAQCRLCGDILVSEHRHDFRECSCGEIFVDGGTAYIRRGYKTDVGNIIDLSIFEQGEKDETENLSVDDFKKKVRGLER